LHPVFPRSTLCPQFPERNPRIENLFPASGKCAERIWRDRMTELELFVHTAELNSMSRHRMLGLSNPAATRHLASSSGGSAHD